MADLASQWINDVYAYPDSDDEDDFMEWCMDYVVSQLRPILLRPCSTQPETRHAMAPIVAGEPTFWGIAAANEITRDISFNAWRTAQYHSNNYMCRCDMAANLCELT